MDTPNEIPTSGALTVPTAKGITHVQIQREHGAKWELCDWYNPGSRTYDRRLAVHDGTDLQPWILERFGSGRYRLCWYKDGKNGGMSAPCELADPEHPQRALRHGAAPAALPAMPPDATIARAPYAASSTPQAPTWHQLQELQERAAERERTAALERLAAIRADEDERRARREREEEDRRRRDREDLEYRAQQDRERARAELEAVRERHKLDLERSRQEHEMKLRQIEIERERERERLDRDRAAPDDFAEAMEAMEERLAERFKPAEPPKSELMQAIGPFMPQIVQALSAIGGAAQRAAAARPAAPIQAPPQGDGTT